MFPAAQLYHSKTRPTLKLLLNILVDFVFLKCLFDQKCWIKEKGKKVGPTLASMLPETHLMYLSPPGNTLMWGGGVVKAVTIGVTLSVSYSYTVSHD